MTPLTKTGKTAAFLEFVVIGLGTLVFLILLIKGGSKKTDDPPPDKSIILSPRPFIVMDAQEIQDYLTEVLDSLGWTIPETFQSDFDGWVSDCQKEFLADLEGIFNRRHLPLSLFKRVTMVAEDVTSSSRAKQIEYIGELLERLLDTEPRIYMKEMRHQTREPTRKALILALTLEFNHRVRHGPPSPKSKYYRDLSDRALAIRMHNYTEMLGWEVNDKFMKDMQGEWLRVVREEFAEYLEDLVRKHSYWVIPVPEVVLQAEETRKLEQVRTVNTLLEVLLERVPSNEMRDELDHTTYAETRSAIIQGLIKEYEHRRDNGDFPAFETLMNNIVNYGRAHEFVGHGVSMTRVWTKMVLGYGRTAALGAEVVVFLITMGLLLGLNILLYLAARKGNTKNSLIWLVTHSSVTLLICSFEMRLMWYGAPVYPVLVPIFLYILYRVAILYFVSLDIFHNASFLIELMGVWREDKVKQTFNVGEEEQIPTTASSRQTLRTPTSNREMISGTSSMQPMQIMK